MKIIASSSIELWIGIEAQRAYNEILSISQGETILHSNMTRFSLSACDYLVFTGDSEDENCHLAPQGGFTFQVSKLANTDTLHLGKVSHILHFINIFVLNPGYVT